MNRNFIIDKERGIIIGKSISTSIYCPSMSLYFYKVQNKWGQMREEEEEGDRTPETR